MSDAGFKLYIVFIMSWFLRMPTRLPFLGAMRMDLLLAASLFFIMLNSEDENSDQEGQDSTGRLLKLLLAYSILTIPFVEWPGTVIKIGLPNFIKGLLFYFFTKQFVTSERKLGILIVVFLGCQLFRIVEPMYLHLRYGYWGAAAYMSGESLDRLSGSPSDVIGPNGLAFVVLTVIPFLFFLRNVNASYMMAFFVGMPISLYVLALTGSRSGLIGLLVVAVAGVLKSKNKGLLIVLILIFGMIGFSHLSPDLQDRYMSIFDSSRKNAATAEGRVEGVKDDLNVALRRPLFGHGLGTSLEANYHFRGVAQLSHNLYTEIAQELGFAGLIIYLFFMKSILVNFRLSHEAIKLRSNQSKFLEGLARAMPVWLAMNIWFSFASYGLSSYEWYLFGGFSFVLKDITCAQS